jgi:signal transduction histidine kinase
VTEARLRQLISVGRARVSELIDHARLDRKVEARDDELERVMLTSRVTAEIARSVGGETDLSRILELIVERGRALVDAHSMLIFLVEGEELVIAATAGAVAASLRGRRFAADGTAMGEALRTGRVVRVDDLVAELAETASQPDPPVSPSQIAQFQAPKSLQIPMVFRGRALGILSTVSRDWDAAPDPDELDQLRTFAASAATAVATARSVGAQSLRRSLEAAEHERTRWAQELHDETLQDLASVNVLLSTARRSPRADQRGQAIDAAMAQVTESIRNLRSLISDLRPAALDELGVVPAVEALVDRVGAISGLQIALDMDLEPGSDRLEVRVEPAVELTIYRLTQEALTNVVKHADAEQVRIRIIEANGWIEVTVNDDGHGFDATAHTEGFGLLGMRERVELAGGSFELHSDPDGTTVCARLPAPRRSRD